MSIDLVQLEQRLYDSGVCATLRLHYGVSCIGVHLILLIGCGARLHGQLWLTVVLVYYILIFHDFLGGRYRYRFLLGSNDGGCGQRTPRSGRLTLGLVDENGLTRRQACHIHVLVSLSCDFNWCGLLLRKLILDHAHIDIFIIHWFSDYG